MSPPATPESSAGYLVGGRAELRVRVGASVTLALALALTRTRTLTAGYQAGHCCSAACDAGERNSLKEVGERTAGGGGGRIATISPPPPSGVRACVSKARRLTGCGTAGSPGVLALWRSRRSSAALYAARVAAGWPTWISESLGGSAFTMRVGDSRSSCHETVVLNFSEERKRAGAPPCGLSCLGEPKLGAAASLTRQQSDEVSTRCILTQRLSNAASSSHGVERQRRRCLGRALARFACREYTGYERLQRSSYATYFGEALFYCYSRVELYPARGGETTDGGGEGMPGNERTNEGKRSEGMGRSLRSAKVWGREGMGQRDGPSTSFPSPVLLTYLLFSWRASAPGMTPSSIARTGTRVLRGRSL